MRLIMMVIICSIVHACIDLCVSVNKYLKYEQCTGKCKLPKLDLYYVRLINYPTRHCKRNCNIKKKLQGLCAWWWLW